MEAIALSGIPPTLDAGWVWSQLIGGPAQTQFEESLTRAIATRRWFGAKTRKRIRAAQIVDAIPLAPEVRVLLVQFEFVQGPAEVYQIPLACAWGHQAERLLADAGVPFWARIQLGDLGETALVFEGLSDPTVCQDLLGLIEAESSRPGTQAGKLTGWKTASFASVSGDSSMPLAPKIVQSEQSNSSIIFGERMILKLFRRIETGLNPDLEMNAYLTERGFPHIPPLAGAIEYHRSGQEPWAAAMLQGFVSNQGDAWQYTMTRLDGFFEQSGESSISSDDALSLPVDGIIAAAQRDIPLAARRAFSAFLSDAEKVGSRTAQMHIALAADTADPSSRAEPFTLADGEALDERCQRLADEVFELLRGHLTSLPESARSLATQVIRSEGAARERMRWATAKPIHAWQIRCHGDFHLGQLLVTGDEFIILDFEGEPARSLAERRKKQLALRDVSGMIRSYHYASCAAAARAKQRSVESNAPMIESLANAWYFWMSVAFLSSYRAIAAGAVFLPGSDEEFEGLLATCLMEKALYELRYEMNNRPDWVELPLRALIELVNRTTITE